MGNGAWGTWALPITNYQLPSTHYQLPITNYPLLQIYQNYPHPGSMIFFTMSNDIEQSYTCRAM